MKAMESQPLLKYAGKFYDDSVYNTADKLSHIQYVYEMRAVLLSVSK